MNRPNISIRENSTFDFHIQDNVLFLKEEFTIGRIDQKLSGLLKKLHKFPHSSLVINLDGLSQIDSAGVATLEYLEKVMQQSGVSVEVEGGSGSIRNNLTTFSGRKIPAQKAPQKTPLFEAVGDKTYRFIEDSLKKFVILMANIFYWSFTDLLRARAHRKGDFVNQAVLIGVNALPIVGAMAFLIGLVLALQSAAQLRQFGANIFIVDLTVIAMTREMGPLITAIIVAGRSGSSIASEIATMKVTEELDALTTMALNPIRFIVVPKMQASVFTMPFLAVLATLLGISGGMAVAYVYLDISPVIFYNRMKEALYFRDIITGFIKSLVFAGIIVVTGSFFGLQVKKGAEGVGRVTTSSVVVAISLVILVNSLLGLVFY